VKLKMISTNYSGTLFAVFAGGSVGAFKVKIDPGRREVLGWEIVP
jgi:hypothetical protein